MASDYSSLMLLELMADTEKEDLWGPIANRNIERIEVAVAGVHEISDTSGTVTLSDTNGGENEAQFARLKCTATLLGNLTIVIPNRTKNYVIENATSGAFTVTVKTSAGTGYVVPQGYVAEVHCNGSNSVLPTQPIWKSASATQHESLVGGDDSTSSIARLLSTNTGLTAIHFGDEDDDDVGRIEYTHSDNVMAFYVGAAKKMELTSTGLNDTVIGATTAAAATFTTVNTSDRITITFSDTSKTGLVINQDDSGADWQALTVNANANTGNFNVIGFEFDSIAAAVGPGMGAKRTGAGETSLHFFVTSSDARVEAVQILNSGFVGIGGAPSKMLHLQKSSGSAEIRIEGDDNNYVEISSGSTSFAATQITTERNGLRFVVSTSTEILRLVDGTSTFYGTSINFEGIVRVPDGSAAAPGLCFKDDTGNGIFRTGTDAWGLAVNGTSTVTFTTSLITMFTDGFYLQDQGTGDYFLGVNDNSPDAVLSLQATSRVTVHDDTDFDTSSPPPFLVFQNRELYNPGSQSCTAVADDGSGNARFTISGHGFTDGQIVTHSGFSDGNYNGIFTVTGATTNTYDVEETATYTATGTGTVANQGAQAGVILRVGNASSTSAGSIVFERTGSHKGDLIFRFKDASNSSEERFRMTADGEFGIKNNNPTYELDVTGDINCTGSYRAGGTAGHASFGPSAVTSITVKDGIVTAIS